MLVALCAAPAGSLFAQPSVPGVPSAAAQPGDAPQPPAVPETPPLYENTTPRGALHNFLTEAGRTDYETAATHLDLSGVAAGDRATQGPRLARQLKVVLDRTVVVDLQTVSDESEGNRTDNLPANAEKVGSIQSASGTLAVTLRRVREKDGVQVWKFSPALIERVPDLYEEFGYGWLGELVPERFRVMRAGGLEVWQLIGLAGLLVAAWFVGILGRWVFVHLAEPIVRRTTTKVDDGVLHTVRRPVRWVFATAFLAATIQVLRLSTTAHVWVNRLLAAAALVAVIAVVGSVIDGFATTMRARLVEGGQHSGAGVVTFVNRLVKVLLISLAVLGVLQGLGYNVTGLLAGLGIGGIALALAAQKTIENLFGGITLMTDQPVKIGELCRFGNMTGWVEEFRFRSTRIRTLERSVLSIPNSDFSNAAIENLSTRDRFRLATVLRLRCDTTPSQLRQVLASIRALLASEPRVDAQPLNVRLAAFGESSLDIEIQTYVLAPAEAVFLTVREELLLRIMDIVTASGTALAMPARTLFMATGAEADGAVRSGETIESGRDVTAAGSRSMSV